MKNNSLIGYSKRSEEEKWLQRENVGNIMQCFGEEEEEGGEAGSEKEVRTCVHS